MDCWAPITYRDFWDVPRIFVVRYRGGLFLFDCPFDETAEDFGTAYSVSTLPPLREEELIGSWAGLPAKALRSLGSVPVERVRFDPTRRREVDASVLDDLAAKAAS